MSHNLKMSNFYRTRPATQKGLGMMEVIITILVMTIGLLGMVTLQLTTLRGATISNQRYVASDLAYEISERIRTNPADAAEYVKFGSSAKATKDCSSPKVQCTIVEEDMFWMRNSIENIKAVLPNGYVEITESAGVYTATVVWNELKALQNATKSGVANFDKRTFTMEFQL